MYSSVVMQGIKEEPGSEENDVRITDFNLGEWIRVYLRKVSQYFLCTTKNYFENVTGLSIKVWIICSFARIAAGETKKRLTKLGRMTRYFADNRGKNSPPRLFIYLIFANSRFDWKFSQTIFYGEIRYVRSPNRNFMSASELQMPVSFNWRLLQRLL